ncbi:hypothetical protein DFR24_4843 [Panacagrimonas perspica]|uniref:Uncharacterized protein n=1 Tax=Panacagrimonas perspica TaxID=381431 RepID=A0A4R7NR30_9GAMM|nr:hypothetical protein [Panacagrimonas perspica]TDU23317.1 hypothetical protein DFR24_4843 [Panacagrimonas perspica]THD02485.1 hypothetical protein B1810_14255 [Panacagrimonas perspica]
MKIRFSPVVFSAAFCVTYALAFQFDLHLFAYYPLVKEFHIAQQPATSGPGMMWYGILATATLAACICAVLIPHRWLDRPLASWLWVFPIGCAAAYVFFMRSFFL